MVKTSASSWAETDLDGLFQRSRRRSTPADRKGPVPIAVAVDADLKQMGVPDGKDARMAVFGSTEFADNRTSRARTSTATCSSTRSAGWSGSPICSRSARARCAPRA